MKQSDRPVLLACSRLVPARQARAFRMACRLYPLRMEERQWRLDAMTGATDKGIEDDFRRFLVAVREILGAMDRGEILPGAVSDDVRLIL